jgi:serine/threonine-protein kinase
VSIGTGTRLGQYEIQDFIGEGAMGRVYRAYHSELERIGAVKVVQAITPDADTVARFRHEAQAIARLRHPNIVEVYDFGAFEGTPFMIVEYVAGGSLAAKMAGGKLSSETAMRYLRGIAAGLDYAHSHGVVHRDVKPANVLLTAEDAPVLADFGLAKLMQGSSLKSMTGVTTGTPAYMAPEQVTGSKVGPAADRYSLATMAYEMLTGAIPFDGEGLMELLYAQVHREPRPPSSRNPALGPRVDAVIVRGLAKDPAARWESASAFVDALGTALSVSAEAAAAPTLVMTPQVASTVPLAAVAVAERVATMPVMSSVATVFPSPPPYVAARPKRGRRAVALIAIGLVLVLVLAVGGVVAWSTGNRQATISLSPDSVVAGDTIVVTASNVPPNQVGEVQLWSIERRVAFRADRNGDVSVTLDIPRDLEPGDHHVKVCWRGTCHGEQVLHVIAPIALATPNAAGSPSQSPTPSAIATPRATPRVSPSPNPTVNPCPIPTAAARLTESPAAVLAGLTTVTIAGANFTPYRTVVVNYYVKNALGTTTLKGSWTRTTGCYGGFSVIFTPGAGDVGTATISARDQLGRQAYVSFPVT